jgi:hypothetical protein
VQLLFLFLSRKDAVLVHFQHASVICFNRTIVKRLGSIPALSTQREGGPFIPC